MFRVRTLCLKGEFVADAERWVGAIREALEDYKRADASMHNPGTPAFSGKGSVRQVCVWRGGGGTSAFSGKGSVRQVCVGVGVWGGHTSQYSGKMGGGTFTTAYS